MLYELPNSLGDSARVSGPIVPRFQNTVTTQQPKDGLHRRIISVQMVTHLKGRHKMYLICNIGLAGGKITYCQSACMVVYQPTQEKERRREKLVWPNNDPNHRKQNNPNIIAPHSRQKIFYQLSRCKALAVWFSSHISAPCYAPKYAGL